MRKLLLFLLAFSLLTSCNDSQFSKKASKEETADKDDRDKGKDEDDDRDDKKNKDDDTESNWTTKQRNKWLNECIDAASSNPQARELCSCVLEKVERKYPDSEDAEKVSEAEATRLAKECLAGIRADGADDDGEVDTRKVADDGDEDNNQGGGWSNLQRKQFVRGCATTAKQAQGFTTEQANSYCDCMTRKLERKHTFQEAGRMKPEDFQTEEWQNAADDCRSGIDD